mgnify:CR=1 FL=1
MGKLTSLSIPTTAPKQLTTNVEASFILGFKYKLENGYSFKEMSQRNIKDFQNFLDKVCKMTVQQVDTAYSRKPDSNDVFQGKRIRHYSVTDSFRIHVVLDEGVHMILRLDPNHNFHK